MSDKDPAKPMEPLQCSRREALILFGGLVFGLTGCTTPEAYESQIDKGLTDPNKRDIAIGIMSTFETSTVRPRYNFAEDLGDGRGITAGPWGVTTKWGDLLAVVQGYTKKTPNNALAKYLPALEAIAAQKSGDTESIAGLVDVWQNIPNTDEDFIAAQKEVFATWYFEPAIERAKATGIESSLGQLIIVDTAIQHGAGKGPDGLPAILEEVKAIAGPTAENEAVWLSTYLKVRRQHLLNPDDQATAKVWADSVDRIDMLQEILDTGNLELNLPLEWGGYRINTLNELQ